MSVITAEPSTREIVIATIANGANLSDGVSLMGGVVVGIQMPAVWDAANLTFQVSMDNVTWLNAYGPAGSELVITVTAASTHIWVDPNNFAGFRWLKVRSGTAGTPVNQTTGADPRLIELIARRIA